MQGYPLWRTSKALAMSSITRTYMTFLNLEDRVSKACSLYFSAPLGLPGNKKRRAIEFTLSPTHLHHNWAHQVVLPAMELGGEAVSYEAVFRFQEYENYDRIFTFRPNDNLNTHISLLKVRGRQMQRVSFTFPLLFHSNALHSSQRTYRVQTGMVTVFALNTSLMTATAKSASPPFSNRKWRLIKNGITLLYA
jgi:hypothetical protein